MTPRMGHRGGTILRGAFFVSTAVARSAMILQKQGRIVNIGSDTRSSDARHLAVLRGAGRHDADDEGPGGGMGSVRHHGERAGTGLVQDAANRDPLRGSGVGDHVVREDPRGPHGPANDWTARWCSSADAAEYVTGQLLFVDGGFSIGAMSAC